MNIGLLVEGHGEFYAAPILVRRVAESLGAPCVVRSVIRQPRSTIIKPGELERAVTLLGNKVGNGGAVLVLIDADDDPACMLGPELLGRAMTARPDRRTGVVLAQCANTRRGSSRLQTRRVGGAAFQPTSQLRPRPR